MPGAVAAKEQLLGAIAASIPALRAMVVAYATEVGGTAAAVDAVALAVTEACTNVVAHAYLDRARGPIRVRAAAPSPGVLQVTVRDYGRGMAPRARRSPGLGLGLMLMSRLAREMHLEQPHGGGTLVLLTFDLGPPGGARA